MSLVVAEIGHADKQAHTASAVFINFVYRMHKSMHFHLY
jgi:hypothetical protein